MKLPPEVEQGNIEYKLKINPEKNFRLVKLSTQLKWRCVEGNGMAIYFIGVSDSGNIVGLVSEELNTSLDYLKQMVQLNGAEIVQKNINQIKSGTFWASIVIVSPVD